MCRAVRCRICGKVTWAGCGDHVDQALAGFAADDLCEGHEGDVPRSAAAWARFLEPLSGGWRGLGNAAATCSGPA